MRRVGDKRKNKNISLVLGIKRKASSPVRHLRQQAGSQWQDISRKSHCQEISFLSQPVLPFPGLCGEKLCPPPLPLAPAQRK